MSTEVAKKQETGISVELLDDLLSDEGAGVNFDVSEMEVPFVRLAHPMSDAMNKTKPAFIKELRSGDIYNTITRQIWDAEEGITVVPVHQETVYTHKKADGSFARYTMRDPELHALLKRVVRDGAKEWIKDDHGNNESELVKADNYYCVIIDKDGTTQKAIIDFRSTGLKVSRRWKTQISMQKLPNSKGELKTPPLYGIMWNFSGVDESNDRGSWSSWSIRKIGPIDRPEVKEEAQQFREMILKGEVKAQEEVEDSAPAGTTTPSEDDVPF